MDDLERELRDLLTDDRLTVHVRPDATRVVHDGVRRRRRNRAAALTVSAAVVTVVALGGALLTRGPAGSATVQPGGDDQTPSAPAVGELPSLPASPDNEIAWNPIEYDATAAFALPGTTPDAAVPWCDAKTVEVTASEFQGATGSAAGGVTVTNNGTGACGLQGSPAITGFAGDKAVALPADDDAFVVHPWIALQAGQSAQSNVQIFGDTSQCLDPIDRLDVDLGHGAPASLDAAWVGGGTVKPRCGTVPRSQQIDHYVVSAGTWTHPNHTAPLPMSDLGVTTAEVPSSVMQGATIRYQVVLATHGTELDPCPPFREQLVAADGTTYASRYYLLDCNAISDVDASSYRLDMELTLPGNQPPNNAVPPGDYVLQWQTPIPGVGDTAGPTIHVTAAPPDCEQRQLDITPGRAGAAGGSYYDRVLITNTSAQSCSLRGYPGVQFVDGNGDPLPTLPDHDTTRAYETIVLPARGGVASFLLSGSDSPPEGAQTCPATKGLLIIAPNLAEQVLVRGVAMNCSDGAIRVYPVVAGAHAEP